ncbi:ATP-binding protein [Corynebacterium pelargi]|uniref:Magnesium-chelatase 38 kDa subunit n=1 Tax=Corynebacterium pelargi TaxID=1471400 RepID=A0A410W859_9CORY|nr:AAA family ATPase [Corynebacterium pelargi]QAU52142.1 Magnesium-chelatase 38 kDa subunit [Corynebacterium pelargi]GGG69851.1 magnesium chelatase [Corynebacterium pelargi]
MADSRTLFPFSAVVGQERLQLALILSAIQPRIGGVVIRGEKGTAKTTTVRAFARLLFDAPLVNLPIGATDDRVVGSINMETVLTTGKAEYQPGLLAAADGGVLYVDEVNLLPDHLVDALLDAAATGVVTVERDSVSFSSSANFVLVGTMNPEEGELRPQLLDRFGLAVDVTASRDVEVRAEVMRRRLAFEAQPEAFIAQWASEDAALAERIRTAQTRLESLQLSDVNLARIAHLCASFDVDGMRADLVIARTALAHAAWRGASEVEDEDIRVAAELALPHRKRRNPFDEPGLDQEQLDNAMDEAQQEHPDESEPPQQEEQEQAEEQQPPESPEQQESDDAPTQDGKEDSATPGAPFRA